MLTKEQLDKIIDENNLLKRSQTTIDTTQQTSPTAGLRGSALLQSLQPVERGGLGEIKQPKKPGFFSRLGTRIKGSITEQADIVKKEDEGKINKLAEFVGIGGVGAKLIADTGFDAIASGAKKLFSLLPDEIEDETKRAVVQKTQNFFKSESGKSIIEIINAGEDEWNKFEKAHPSTAETVKGATRIAEVIPVGFATGKGYKVTRELAEAGIDAGKKVVSKVDDFTSYLSNKIKSKGLDKEAGIIDDINLLEAPKTDKLNMPKTKIAEAEAPKISFTEKIAGIRPDIKKRIQGKTKKFDEYLDVAKARNFDDTLDSPLSYASKKVLEVRDTLNKQLSDVGSDIGSFRRKLETVKAPVESIQKVISTFDEQIAKKGLTVNKLGQLITAGGRETVFSPREIKELLDIRNSLIRLKGDPQLIRIMDNRFNIDKKINFAKQAQEISGEIDPISRAVRADLKAINESVVGASEASKLAEFSELSNLLVDLNKLTSKGQNAEFLLKRVLSERDRLPKEVLDSVLKQTGVDLLDEAQFSQIVTELVGNPQMTGLFRQEIEKAGLSVASLLNPKIGAFTTLLQKVPGIEGFIKGKVEKSFRDATKLTE